MDYVGDIDIRLCWTVGSQDGRMPLSTNESDQEFPRPNQQHYPLVDNSLIDSGKLRIDNPQQHLQNLTPVPVNEQPGQGMDQHALHTDAKYNCKRLLKSFQHENQGNMAKLQETMKNFVLEVHEKLR